MNVVIAKYLNADGGGGTFEPLSEGDPQAKTLSKEALQG